MASCQSRCVEAVPETLYAAITSAFPGRVCKFDHEAREVSIDGVAWPWDEARQAYVSPDGCLIRLGEPPPPGSPLGPLTAASRSP